MAFGTPVLIILTICYFDARNKARMYDAGYREVPPATRSREAAALKRTCLATGGSLVIPCQAVAAWT